MRLVTLDGTWRVTHVDSESDIASFLQASFVPEGWLVAHIPEEIHATLRREGVIRGNTYSKHEDEDAWIENKDWVYYREFYAEEYNKNDIITLHFDGLDTLCEIYLNGCSIGEHRNMHTPCELDITNKIQRNKRNVIIVRIFSAVRYGRELDDDDCFSITTSERLFVRKAQMNYSWDFCGRCVTAGIWKSVRIKAQESIEIDSYYLYTKEISDGIAVIGLETALKSYHNAATSGCVFRASLMRGGALVAAWEGEPDKAEQIFLTVEDPVLWWPLPYGEPALYDFSLTLSCDGMVLDEKHQRFGIRTIRVEEELQDDGKSFRFVVNNKPLFIRGANWVPINTVYTDIDDDDYIRLLRSATQAHISMLRIWGGGIYEPPIMFELCDELGILLWSDFMLACGIYPQSDEFSREIAAEADFVLKAYRNYTCLAIWSGDNENGQAYGWAGRPFEFENDVISNHVLRGASEKLDPYRYFLPTSPASPDPMFRGGDNPSSPYQGDLHLYIMSAHRGVNKNRDYGKDYYKRVLGFRPRFMSEFGFVSLPEKESYYRFNAHREPLRNPAEIIKFLPLTKKYLDNGDIDSVIYYSQLFNSLALKYWIEYFRSLKGICGGTLYWKFNDPMADCPDDWMYPSQMSAVDMYGNYKMTYFFTRRAYEDLMIAFIETQEGLCLYACNETDQGGEGILYVAMFDFTGEELYSIEHSVQVEADAATKLYTLSRETFAVKNVYNTYLKASLIVCGQCVENRYFYVDLNELDQLQLPKAFVRITNCDASKKMLCLTLQTDTYARSVRLNILDCCAEYEDNYFDMDAGSERIVHIQLPETDALSDRALYLEGENFQRMVYSVGELLQGSLPIEQESQ